MPSPSPSKNGSHAQKPRTSDGYAQLTLHALNLTLIFLNRHRKSHDASEALRLEPYLYSPASVQERVTFGNRSSATHKIGEMWEKIKEIEGKIEGEGSKGAH